MGSHDHKSGEWDREQVEPKPDVQTTPPDREPQWDKQFVEADELPEERHGQRADEGLGAGDSDLSGHGNQPGGGKRFGDINEG